MILNPLALEPLQLIIDPFLALDAILRLRQVQQKLLVGCQTLQGVLILLDLAPDRRDLLIKLLDAVIFRSLFSFELLLVLFFLLSQGSVLGDVVMKVHLVVLKLLRAIFEGLVSSGLLLLELFNFLLDRVVGELGQEHLLLLVDELVGVLGALLFWELHAAPCDMHCLVDKVLLLCVVVALLIIALRW